MLSRRKTVRIGDATLILGDCREAMPRIGDQIDALVTDPPFGIPHRFGENRSDRKGTRRLQFAWDGLETNETVFSAISAAVQLVGAAFVFCGLTQASHIAEIIRGAGLVDKPAAWVKKCPPPAGFGNWWPSAFELAVYGYRRGAWFGDLDPRRNNVFVADSYRHGQPGKVGHPTRVPPCFPGSRARSSRFIDSLTSASQCPRGQR